MFLVPAIMQAQVSVCEVRQFLGDDSLHQELVKTETYNARGQLISEVTKGYQISESHGWQDGTTLYSYNDTLRTQVLMVDAVGDSVRIEYAYNAQGQLNRQRIYNYRLSAPSARDEYVPAHREWALISESNYTYDRWGRKIIEDASRVHMNPMNLQKWEYDDQGRVNKHEVFQGTRLAYKEDYQYFDNGYRYWRTSFDSQGNMKHENDPETGSYAPMMFYTYKLDTQKRVVEERITDEKQQLHGRTTTSYGANGKIARKVNYGPDDQRFVTHIYSYK